MDPIWDELEDRVEQVFTATDKLREVVGDGKTTRQFLDSIFRNVHSIKASAAANELPDLASIAHQFENLLHALRTGKTQLEDRVLQAFDDACTAMYSCLRQSEQLGSPTHQELVARLQSLSGENGKESEVDAVLKAVPPEIRHSLSEEEKHRLEQALGEGATLFLVNTTFDLSNFDQLFQELKTRLTRVGELISTAPKVHDQHADKIDFRILYTSDLGLAQVHQEIGELQNVAINQVPSKPHTSTEVRSTRVPSKSSEPQLIRIDVEDLDQLISSTHQLFRDTHECLARMVSNSPEFSTLRATVASIDASFLSLASELVNLRMVSLERVLQRAFRSGRSVAAKAGKEIDFRVVGHDLRIDKSLSDAIADPLMHLVRNAVDHGIEGQAERIKAGKNQRGTICIEATASQGQTRIRVTDDGRGIDPERVLSSGQRLGLLTASDKPDVNLSMRLIFRPGFTTASTISETSGRGVGLDVVESAIEGIGGSIRVDSDQGAGSVFEIRLPVTFGLLDVLIVKVGGFRYLIDAAQLGPMPAAEDARMLRLDSVLRRQHQESEPPVLLYCGFDAGDNDQLSLALDHEQPIETEQVLVRNLGSRGGRWFGVAGAAEMRDGGVALLLDLPALVKRYMRKG